jgi:signal transduction histidine kinase
MSISPEQEIEILAFLRNLSHELRSPLASILGYAELILLSEEELPEEIKANAQAIYNNGIKLQEIIDQIQDYRKHISGNN